MFKRNFAFMVEGLSCMQMPSFSFIRSVRLEKAVVFSHVSGMLLNQGIIIGSDGLIARHHRSVMIGSTARYPENVTLTGSHQATRFASVNLCLLPIKLICDMYHLNYIMLVLINHYDMSLTKIWYDAALPHHCHFYSFIFILFKSSFSPT